MIEKKVQRHHKEARGQIQKATRSLKQVNVMKTKGRGESRMIMFKFTRDLIKRDKQGLPWWRSG